VRGISPPEFSSRDPTPRICSQTPPRCFNNVRTALPGVIVCLQPLIAELSPARTFSLLNGWAPPLLPPLPRFRGTPIPVFLAWVAFLTGAQKVGWAPADPGSNSFLKAEAQHSTVPLPPPRPLKSLKSSRTKNYKQVPASGKTGFRTPAGGRSPSLPPQKTPGRKPVFSPTRRAPPDSPPSCGGKSW